MVPVDRADMTNCDRRICRSLSCLRKPSEASLVKAWLSGAGCRASATALTKRKSRMLVRQPALPTPTTFVRSPRPAVA
jgi:hypothetical protein